jgi:hypothetical protein
MKLKNFKVSLTAIVLCNASFFVQHVLSAQTPNILFIMTDDQGNSRLCIPLYFRKTLIYNRLALEFIGLYAQSQTIDSNQWDHIPKALLHQRILLSFSNEFIHRDVCTVRRLKSQESLREHN